MASHRMTEYGPIASKFQEHRLLGPKRVERPERRTRKARPFRAEGCPGSSPWRPLSLSPRSAT